MRDARPGRRSLSRVSLYTFRYHLVSSAFEGALNGVFAINDVVARKTFGAGPVLMVLLTMAPSVAQLLALALAPRTARSDLRGLFLRCAVLGRLSLVTVAFVTGAWSFLALVLLNAVVQTVVLPAQNAVYQANYAPRYRGRLFAWATVATSAVTVLAAYGAGAAMDRNPGAYRLVYPGAALAGFLALQVFGRIRLRRTEDPPPGKAMSAWGLVRELPRRDRAFLRFEAAFMLYGLGFMSIQPCLAPFLVDVMQMGYREASAAKGAFFYALMLLATPVAGWLHDRIGLERLGALACGGLFVFTASLVLVTTRPAVFAAFGLYGACMACIHVAWNMGPIKYAGAHDASPYMGLHVALVGVRGLLGHPLGGFVAAVAGTPRATFGLAALFFLSASVWMFLLPGVPGSPRAMLAPFPPAAE